MFIDSCTADLSFFQELLKCSGNVLQMMLSFSEIFLAILLNLPLFCSTEYIPFLFLSYQLATQYDVSFYETSAYAMINIDEVCSLLFTSIFIFHVFV